MITGRPTLYTEETVSKVRDYLAQYKLLGEVIPTVEGLAVYLGIARDTVYDWARQEDKKSFSDVVDNLKALQASVLINGSLKGDLNAVISKLMLSSKHDYRESTDVTSNGQQLGVVVLPSKEIKD